MNLNLIKNEVCICNEKFSDTLEQSIDGEFLLPDYYPDIARILKCKGTAKILTKTSHASGVTVTGTVMISLFYIDHTDSKVRCYQTTVSFTKEVSADIQTENGKIEVSCCLDYLNCRLSTPRKFDIHGTVSIRVEIKENESIALLSTCDDKHMQLKTKQIDHTKEICSTERSVSLNEELEVTPSLSGISSVLYAEAAPVFLECRTVTGKSIVKGDLHLRILFDDVHGDIKTHETNVPFSQILDANGVDEYCDCDVSMDLSSLEVRTRTGMDGECRSINLSATVQIKLTVSKTTPEIIVVDAYSTEYEIVAEAQHHHFDRRLQNLDETFTVSERFDFPQAISKVIDTWCFIKYDNCKIEQGSITVNSLLCCEVLALTQDQTPIYLEKTFEFSQQFSLEDKDVADVLLDPQLIVLAEAYALTGETSAEIRCEIRLISPVYTRMPLIAITQIKADPEIKKEQDRDISLVVYFARCGESVWEIARKYNTSCAAITASNRLKEDHIEQDQMLMIPII